jgi:hypothetical protein
MKNWAPTVTIGIAENSIPRFDTNATYTMIESMVYFDAFRPVLEALQWFGKNGNLPFSDILLGKNRKVDMPAYLREKAEAPYRRKKQEVPNLALCTDPSARREERLGLFLCVSEHAIGVPLEPTCRRSLPYLA